jgi:hypothetical protein
MTSPTPAWNVTSQNQATEQDTTGNFVQGWRVYYQLASGTTGSVFLSDAMYTADNVKAAIAAKVATMNDVEALSG